MSLLKNQPKNLVDSISTLLDSIRETDSSVTDQSTLNWIEENRQSYRHEFGLEEGDRLLEVRAWLLKSEASKKAHKKLQSINESVKDEDDESTVKTIHRAQAQSGLPELGEEKVASSEPSSALGYCDQNTGNPKHVDLVHDCSIIGGVKTDGYRLLLQYPDARPVEFWPPVELPCAPTIQSLWDISIGISDKFGAINAAISAALDIPSEQPQFTGNDKK